MSRGKQIQNLPERLKSCIEKCGSQSALLAKVDLSRSQLNRYLDGEAVPPIGKLEDIALAAGVSPAWLALGLDESFNGSRDVFSNTSKLEKIITAFEEGNDGI